jgi:hypothetical protein
MKTESEIQICMAASWHTCSAELFKGKRKGEDTLGQTKNISIFTSFMGK